jgi:hypothetical protein
MYVFILNQKRPGRAIVGSCAMTSYEQLENDIRNKSSLVEGMAGKK